MLQKIRVSGFRSLNDFEMDFKSGLNILVGPNGAGKSNILDFMLFLSEYSKRTVEEAIGRSSGAGAVFTRTTQPNEKRFLSFELEGATSANSDIFGRYIGIENRDSKYKYKTKIVFEPSDGLVYIESQELEFYFKSKSGKFAKLSSSSRHIPDLHVIMRGNEKKTFELEIIRLDLRKIEPRSIFRQKNPVQIKDPKVLQSYFSSGDVCFLNELSFLFPRLESIVRDLHSGQVFNVNPAAARLTSDIAREETISPDGAGLPSLIWALERAANFPREQLRRPRGRLRPDSLPRRIFPSGLMDDLKRLVQMVNQEIVGIRTEREIYDNEIKLIYVVSSESGDIDLPASLMSDGTTKWTALMAAVLSRQSIFAIEEPENFLHPRMLEVLLDTIRTRYSHINENSFLIVTTHSQTLLDLCNPKDIVIVSMEHGKTKAQRIREVESIQEEINRTGFGLGHFYLTGLLDVLQ